MYENAIFTFDVGAFSWLWLLGSYLLLLIQDFSLSNIHSILLTSAVIVM